MMSCFQKKSIATAEKLAEIKIVPVLVYKLTQVPKYDLLEPRLHYKVNFEQKCSFYQKCQAQLR